MIDWDELQRLLAADALAALRATLAAQPRQRWYAAAFYGSYRELDGAIWLPTLAINSLGGLGRTTPLNQDPREFWSEAWNPPDWEHNDIEFVGPALLAAAAAVDRAAQRASREQWLAIERQWMQALVGASRELQRGLLADGAALAPDFVVFVHDEGSQTSLLRECIGEAAFARLFPIELEREAERARLLTLAPRERTAVLMDQIERHDGAFGFEQAQALVCAAGTEAVPVLLAGLNGRDACHAAMLLGRIGVAAPETIAALRARFDAEGEASAREWAARALAFLGDQNWLFERLAHAPKGPALGGLCAPYRASRDQTRCGLDYAPLERLLSGPAAIAARTLDVLKPGTSYCSLRGDELDTALRALASTQTFVRAHAVALMGERGLGAAAAVRLLPALVERMRHDPEPQVRWFATLSLGYWKADARPYRAAFEAARADPDERVRAAAHAALGEAWASDAD